MSTVDTPAEKPVAKPKKKARKRQVRTKPQAAAVSFPGLTETVCSTACSAAGCVISGNETCAHPRKGGLRGPDMSNPEALKRLQSAQKQLAVGAARKRFA
jgi:hypothetical protein